jgi:thiol-disulfide isomerase/thioredoxin
MKIKTGRFTGFAYAGILGLLCLIVVGCGENEPPTPAAAAVPKPTDVTPARTGSMPAAEALTTAPERLQIVVLDDIKAIVAEAAAQDKVLVIDFWATWCVPCIEMFPALHEGLVARGDGVRAVSVTLDDPSREADAVAFLADHDALHDAYIIKNDSAAQQALADGMGENWNSLAVPAILVYDSGGNLVGEFLEGGSTDAILDRVDSLLASGQED